MRAPGYWLPLLGSLSALPWASVSAEQASSAIVLDSTTVTARRREEDPQQVPIPINVLYGEQLDEAGLHTLQDIQQRVPGLVVSGHDARYAGFGLRGFGATAYNDGLEGSVGTYVDGVYQARQGMAFTELMDIERIEVLRGPQGTLFGKNTTAGALNIITRAPTFQPEANLEASYGERGLREYRGTISGALRDDVLAGRLNVFDRSQEGQVENLEDGTRLGDNDSQGLRGQLLWTPNTDFSARLIADHARQNEAGNVLLVNHYSQQTRRRAQFLGYPLTEPDPYQREISVDAPGHPRTLQNGVSLELNWGLDDAMRLTSITAYRDWDYRASRDGDSTALSVAQSETELGIGNSARNFDCPVQPARPSITSSGSTICVSSSTGTSTFNSARTPRPGSSATSWSNCKNSTASPSPIRSRCRRGCWTAPGSTTTASRRATAGRFSVSFPGVRSTRWN